MEPHYKKGTIVLSKPFCSEGFTVSFGEGCIIHPSVDIWADKGDIVFGDNNIIEVRNWV